VLIARRVNIDDLDAIISLSENAGPGFTSLAVGADVLEQRLKKSVMSYELTQEISPDHVYFLLLEDTEHGKVVGMSAIKAQIGIKDPFFNFRILRVGRKSAVTNRRYDMDVLMMVNEYNGASEVGSLYVLPDYRGAGAGRLISQARYMLMASDLDRFSDTVISELRGHVDDDGTSPFWDAVGRKFFQMDFTEADHISAEQDSQFILDLMPRYPIYVELLPKSARQVMGKTHPSGEGARHFLKSEGFRYNGLIDIFDGGPSMSAPINDIRTIKDSRILKPVVSEADRGLTALISNNRIEDFRCVLSKIGFEDDQLLLAKEDMKTLLLKKDEQVRIWIKR